MIKLLGLLFFVASIARAEVPRYEQLNELFRQFNRRYTSGHYVADTALMNDFNSKQDAMANALKKNDGLKKILFIQNDYLVNLNVNVYAFSDEQGRLLGIYWDKSVYQDEEERSFLRFAALDMLANGLKFIPISGTHALMVKGFHLDVVNGGTLQFVYLKNLSTKEMGSATVFLLRKTTGWGLFTEQQVPVSNGIVKTWTGFLNGGVKEFILR